MFLKEQRAEFTRSRLRKDKKIIVGLLIGLYGLSVDSGKMRKKRQYICYVITRA